MTTSGDSDTKPASSAKPPAGLTKKKSKTLYQDWLEEIKAYERDTETWCTRCDKIIRRYRDERDKRVESRRNRYNILWANVQVLRPALYARDPIPRVERRFKQKDAVSRIGAQIVQNCLSYLIECGYFHDKMKQAVLDRLLPGRGVVWIRYEPTFRDVMVQTTDDETGEVTETVEQELAYEKTVPDYVHWKDFGHTWARTWEEVRGVWRISYLGRQELIDRFGDIGRDIPLTHTPDEDDSDKTKSRYKSKIPEKDKKAKVYEIWDSQTKRAIWLCKDYEDGVLDVRDDPLEIEGFFPCPRPMYATLANDDLIPTPDYVLYQDQAAELDELTERISLIVSAIRVAGVYDSSAPGIARLLTEGVENKLIPVSNWAMYAERGGLKSAMDLLPVLQIAQTLQQLYESRDKLKSDIYEITGMSDIIRGATSPNETARAQEIKSQYVNLRLQESQKDVERFARDLLRIMADLIASKFSIETLSNMSGIKLMTQEQKQQVQMGMQSGAQPPPELMELVQKPTWEEVIAVLRNDDVRAFRIEVETDSTIAINDKDEKEGINEFMVSMGQLITGLTQGVKEGIMPGAVAKEIMLHTTRKYRFGSEIEEQLEKMGQQPPVDPQAEQREKELEQKEQELEQASQQLTEQQTNLKAEFEKAKSSIEQERAKFEADTETALAKARADLSVRETEFEAMQKEFMAEFRAEQKIAQVEAVSATQKIQVAVEQFMKKLELPAQQAKEQKDAQTLQGMAQANNEVRQIASKAIDALQVAAAPKNVEVIRDPQTGRATGMKVVPTRPQ